MRVTLKDLMPGMMVPYLRWLLNPPTSPDDIDPDIAAACDRLHMPYHAVLGEFDLENAEHVLAVAAAADSDEVRRRIQAFALACAWRALPIYEAAMASDPRASEMRQILAQLAVFGAASPVAKLIARGGAQHVYLATDRVEVDMGTDSAASAAAWAVFEAVRSYINSTEPRWTYKAAVDSGNAEKLVFGDASDVDAWQCNTLKVFLRPQQDPDELARGVVFPSAPRRSAVHALRDSRVRIAAISVPGEGASQVVCSATSGKEL